MKIGVTSASGQLGSVIIKKAIEAFGSENVVGLARTPDKAKHLGIEIRPGDYNNQAHFEENLTDVDVLVVLSGNDDPHKRILQHQNIINGAKKSSVRKLVYTSIFGEEGKCSFDTVIKSNRQTEKDIATSGLEFAIGRNGLYIEPDLEAIEDYKKDGEIVNSAGEGKCGYTSREELADAYLQLILRDDLSGGVYNLHGEPISQKELAKELNEAFGTNIQYHSMSIDEYNADRVSVYGNFFGMIIGGIYEGIHNGVFNVKSDFEKVTGRKHKNIAEMIK